MKITLQARVFLGFGGFIFLVIALNAFTLTASYKSIRGIDDLKSALDASSQFEAINVQAQRVRLAVGQGLFQPGKTTKEAADNAFATLKAQVADAASSTASDVETELNQELIKAVNDFETAWQEQVKLYNDFSNQYGDEIEDVSDNITASLGETQDIVEGTKELKEYREKVYLIQSAITKSLVSVSSLRAATTDAKLITTYAQSGSLSLKAAQKIFHDNFVQITDPMLKKNIQVAYDNMDQLVGSYPKVIELTKKVNAHIGEIDRSGLVVEDVIKRIQSKKHDEANDSKSALILLLGSANISQWIGGTAIVLFGVGFAFYIVRSMIGPLREMTAVMTQLAEGDDGIMVPSLDRGDEVGAMAKALQVFKVSAQEVKVLQNERAAQAALVETERRKALHAMASKFESSVQAVVAQVFEAAENLQQSSATMSGMAEQTSMRSVNVANAAELASTNVETVASAALEMVTSNQVIEKEINQSTSLTAKAALHVRTTSDTVSNLDESARRIGDVVNLISLIAAQTNLLALNATIEAARAGEAGKGFVVVANEVKELAHQTAAATDQIADQVKEIQSATQATVEAIKAISTIINDVESSSQLIEESVKQQISVANEISHSIHKAAEGTRDVSENIGSMTQVATETGGAAKMVSTASNHIGEQAALLRQAITSFLQSLRAD